jgi:PilZ domain
MALPVMKPERRRSPRISLGELAYINFESNSGGIVVNISDQGLCFHTVTPIPRSDTIRFWFSTGGRRIEADGHLAWLDETRKTGGLRFNVLSAEASRQIRNWTAQFSEPLPATRQAALAVPPSDAPARSSVTEPDKNAQPRPAKPIDSVRWLGTLARWGEFSRGLATGFLIAVVVAALFLFHAYKRQLGESLILLGEHFGATPHSERASPAPTSLPPQVPESSLQRRGVIPAPAVAAIPALGSEKVLAQPPTKAARATHAKPQPVAVAPTISSTPSTVSLPSIDLAPILGPLPPGPAKIAQPESGHDPSDKTMVRELKAASDSVENAEDTAEFNSGVPFGKYFDVGRFKDELGARSTTNDLTHVGFHAIVVHKHVLWMNSYQVLVGPYRDPQAAQVAETGLRSHGFKTHPLARHSRDLTLLVSTKPYADAPAEDFIISWEAYSAEATVRFVKSGNTVAKAQGRWVTLPSKYEYNAIYYNLNGNGSRTLVEIRLHGMNRAVVLPTTLGNPPVIF